MTACPFLSLELKMDLPKPICPLGYTERQIRTSILGVAKTIQFVRFMEKSGLRIEECNGERYSHLQRRPVRSVCHGHAHGKVYYSIDLVRFETHYQMEQTKVAA